MVSIIFHLWDPMRIFLKCLETLLLSNIPKPHATILRYANKRVRFVWVEINICNLWSMSFQNTVNWILASISKVESQNVSTLIYGNEILIINYSFSYRNCLNAKVLLLKSFPSIHIINFQSLLIWEYDMTSFDWLFIINHTVHFRTPIPKVQLIL